MHIVSLAAEDDFEGWRSAARRLAAARVPSDQVLWNVGTVKLDLLAGDDLPAVQATPFHVPKEFVQLAQRVVLHRSPERFSLLYTLLLHVLERPSLLQDRTDYHVHRAARFAQAIRRDIHKMRAFVRFRELKVDDDRRFVAWFEPEHFILRANASFFIGRFANMQWSILTPLGSIHWDGSSLREGPPARRQDAPSHDPVEDIWKTYYASIFNPARLMPNAMLKEMPKKYWKNMPETSLIPELIAGARNRESHMIAKSDAKLSGIKSPRRDRLGFGSPTLE